MKQVLASRFQTSRDGDGGLTPRVVSSISVTSRRSSYPYQLPNLGLS
ncbi:hypothetical protein DM52_1001 [Burkholderia mallei]|nr:hypothetical protein DM52_1001 [Burkholderia mallei]